TLLFEPALITDAKGQATLAIDMADSITTWRMTAMASSKAGALGSTEHPIRVFQDFFVDIDLPVALTKNDRVSIPVVLYNYLESSQKVRIKFDVEPWFELDGDAEQVIELEKEEVRSMYFPIQVKELGKHRLTVWAYGEKMSDAIRREIEVLPDGEETNVTFSDRLSSEVQQTIVIPTEAIDGASKILVRVYPGVYSQIVDGLDSMLQMPFGCFEQTSSTTYPNILIVQYMKATKQINPETQMKAEGFINAGYQRLLSYEVSGGGFSWFGDAPANKVLTAFGLKQFHDMSKVHEVDPAVIERTRAWLLSKQESNGAWKPDENYLHAESWSGIQKSDVLVTAYIVDAILSSEGTGAGVDKAIDYLRANWKDAGEAYVVSLVANAL
ncbi:MAG TPA: alpha-2-macroglobulin family protein, partial [bacterium]|nr:alpha-2-macroglobulin family protein [bacterium]